MDRAASRRFGPRKVALFFPTDGNKIRLFFLSNVHLITDPIIAFRATGS
jgi:hypothetical protein